MHSFTVNEDFTYDKAEEQEAKKQHLFDPKIFENFDEESPANVHSNRSHPHEPARPAGESPPIVTPAAFLSITPEAEETEPTKEETLSITEEVSTENTPPLSAEDVLPFSATPNPKDNALPGWVSHIRDDAYHRGFDAGTKNGQRMGERTGFKKAASQAEERIQNASENEKTRLLLQCAENIEKMLLSVSEDEKARDIHIMELMLDVIDRILPTITQQHQEDEIKHFLVGIIDRLNLKQKIIITLPLGTSSFSDSLKQILQTHMPTESTIEERVAFRESSELGPSDCRIVWDDGAIERNVKEIWQELNQTLRQHDPEHTIHKENPVL